MGETKVLGEIAAGEGIAKRVKERAVVALKDSNFSDVLDAIGADCNDGATCAALKAVLAERMTEYAVRAMGEARRRGVRVGVATVIIAASKGR